MTGVTDAAVRSLVSKVEGQVLAPGDDGYDRVRAVWNAMVDRRPRLIVRCATVGDVVAAVRHARDHDLEIGVRCGGHGILGLAVPDGGLMIDLTPMGGVRVDPQRRRAWVQGGALLGAVDLATQRYALATTAGNVSHTGVGGLTLGGGMGWLARQFGLTCDNVVSFEVVTADGRTVRASADEHPDLFWALRGGGGNFGVVTEFEFHLHPVAGQTLLARLGFALDDAVDVFRGWRDLCSSAPRQATFAASVGELDGRPVGSVGFVWIGDPDEGRRWLAPLRALGRTVAERVEELSYVAVQRIDDTIEEHALRRYWKGHYLYSLPDEAIDAFLLRGTADGRGDMLPAAELQAYGGAIADPRTRTPRSATEAPSTSLSLRPAGRTRPRTSSGSPRHDATPRPWNRSPAEPTSTRSPTRDRPASGAPIRPRSSPGSPLSRTHGIRTTPSTSTTTSAPRASGQI